MKQRLESLPAAPITLLAVLTVLAAGSLHGAAGRPDSLFSKAGMEAARAAIPPGAKSRLEEPPDEVGPNSRVWHATRAPAGAAPRALNAADTNQTAAAWLGRGRGRVEQIATGMNYWNGQNWVPSEPVFVATEEGFVADRVQHKTVIAANLNAQGPITLTRPQGQTLR